MLGAMRTKGLLLGHLGEIVMRRLFLALGSATVVLLLSATPAFTCGDKLLAVNRGLRFQDFSSSRRASILLYSHKGSGSSNPNDKGQLQSALIRAGHRLQTVAEWRELDDALKTGHYDLVLVDLINAPQVEESLRGAASPPLVVPLVYEATKAENKLLKKQYPFLLMAREKDGRYLTVIDRALDARAKRERTTLRRN